MEHTPPRELITRLNTKETRAFEELFHAYYPPLCFFAAKIVKDEDAARDVVQEVFIYFWERNLSFESMAAVKSCLYTSVHNRALNYLSKRDNRKRIQESLVVADREDDFLLRQVESDLFKLIFDAIDELPPQCRAVFTLSYLEQKEIREVASLLNIAETTVKTQRRRAKEFLRARLRGIEFLFLLRLLGEL
ncbi:MAG: RNA polymerase sigma-70 factor [Odoribacteraceae bacterium]|jgi:RNA polymerase sigma-70 factor (ECF subfamily)|nr:RNA polymerase sigma-70 factor [Odoribacteraceae bacterium]